MYEASLPSREAQAAALGARPAAGVPGFRRVSVILRCAGFARADRNKAAAEISAATGRRALPVACHVGRWDDCDRLVDTVYGEFGRCDVLVNNAGVLPGAFDTDVTKAWGPEAKAAAGELNPMKRIGQPQDMVGVCVFLASDAASYVNGAQVLVDGGLYRTL